jgi:hypothetical protein
VSETTDRKKKAKKWYKVLSRHGRSCSGGELKWSLPKGDGPGGWHEVEGPLERCHNGLHLTDDPLPFREAGRRLFLAEYEGETGGIYYHELLCRKVRLVREVNWAELEPSPALTILRQVWRHVGSGRDDHSWVQLNGAMKRALLLAIEAGFRFDGDDFDRFAREFSPMDKWLGVDGIEHAYQVACDGPHGPNPSAYQAVESWLGREPFLVAETARGGSGKDPLGPKVRLYVGKTFDWRDGLKKRVKVTVTSFNDEKGHIIACSYKEQTRESGSFVYTDRKVDRRFSITRDDIAGYHAAIRDFEKRRREAASEKATA